MNEGLVALLPVNDKCLGKHRWDQVAVWRRRQCFRQDTTLNGLYG